jgi:hypothetical protein
MMFPNDWAKFLEDYSFKDKEEVYTNGTILIPVFRVEQMVEHYFQNRWIPASEPPKEWKDENGDAINYLIYSPGIGVDLGNWIQPEKAWLCLGVPFKVTHWMPLPETPKEDAK